MIAIHGERDAQARQVKYSVPPARRSSVPGSPGDRCGGGLPLGVLHLAWGQSTTQLYTLALSRGPTCSDRCLTWNYFSFCLNCLFGRCLLIFSRPFSEARGLNQSDVPALLHADGSVLRDRPWRILVRDFCFSRCGASPFLLVCPCVSASCISALFCLLVDETHGSAGSQYHGVCSEGWADVTWAMWEPEPVAGRLRRGWRAVLPTRSSNCQRLTTLRCFWSDDGRNVFGLVFLTYSSSLLDARIFKSKQPGILDGRHLYSRLRLTTET